MIPIQMIQKKKKNTVLDTVEEIKEQVEVNLNKNTTILYGFNHHHHLFLFFFTLFL